MRSSLGIASIGMIAALSAACSGQGGSGTPPPASSGPAGAAAPAALADRDMIVLLRDRVAMPSLDRASRRARAAAIAASHAALTAELQAARPRAIRSFELVNGFATRLSHAEIQSLSSRPEILAVVPDRAIPKPRPPRLNLAAAGAAPSAVAKDPAVLCNTLEPEALQLTNTAFLDPSIPQAQTVVDGNGQTVTGKGVTVAVIAEGLDPNIPGFIRPDGQSAFVDYQDFSGDPAGSVTGGGEIFGDASSIAAQDMPNGKLLQYDVTQFGAVGAPLPSPCNIRVRGMAPDARMVGIDIFSFRNYSPLSVAVQAVEWAVVHDGVDVINESFGNNYVADDTRDPLSLANAAAVAAGVTVTVATGDAGPFGTFAEPATDPNVIAAGASTSFRLYAQTGLGVFSVGAGAGWVGDQIASFSSGGFSESRARMLDLVAPGDLGWALCSTNTAIYGDCRNFFGQGSPIEIFGGTSEAAPVTAGAAALVIQAYRSTHGGFSPSPALVKSILMSTARDIGAPAAEQGAGLLDALAAVHAALSVQGGSDTAPPSGTGLVATPNAAVLTARPGDTVQRTFQVTNTGGGTMHLRPAIESLGAASAGQAVDLTFDGRTSSATNTFSVPAGVDHLDATIAFPTSTTVTVALLDPQGRQIALSDPQGGGSGTGYVDVARPAAGTYTAVVYGFGVTGTVHLKWGAESYAALGSVSPATLDLPPGGSAAVTATFQVPSTPGDLSAALRFHGGAVSEIPIGVRIVVPTDAHGGAFAGTVTGGNGRPGALPSQTYAFDVPPGVGDLSLAVSTADPQLGLLGFLVDPSGAVLDSASNAVNPGAGESALQLLRATPQPGRWRFVLQNTGSGQETSIPFSATLAFDAANVAATGLPGSVRTRVSAATGATATLQVTNTAAVTKAFFADPRLATLSTRTLTATPGCGATSLPGYCGIATVPPRTMAVDFQAQSSAPITMDASPLTGYSSSFFFTEDPNVWALPVGNDTVAAFVLLPEVTYGGWLLNPALVGPFGPTGAATATVSTTVTALAQPFDAAITSSTGNYWADQLDGTTTFAPLVLAPGASGAITLTLKPDAASVGQQVRGSIYVDAANPADPFASGDEIKAVPYAYTVAK